MFGRIIILLLVLAFQPVVGFATVLLPASSDLAASEQSVMHEHCSDESMESHQHQNDGGECQLECQVCGSCSGMFTFASVEQIDAPLHYRFPGYVAVNPVPQPHEQLYRPPILS